MDEFEKFRNKLQGKSTQKLITTTNPIITPTTYKPQGMYFNKSELKLTKNALLTFFSTYKGNIKKAINKGGNAVDCKNYEEIIDGMELYKKITKKEYYNKELYKLMGIDDKR